MIYLAALIFLSRPIKTVLQFPFKTLQLLKVSCVGLRTLFCEAFKLLYSILQLRQEIEAKCFEFSGSFASLFYAAVSLCFVLRIIAFC